jgi:hypothetical protein
MSVRQLIVIVLFATLSFTLLILTKQKGNKQEYKYKPLDEQKAEWLEKQVSL